MTLFTEEFVTQLEFVYLDKSSMLPQEFLNKYHPIPLKSFSLNLFTFYYHDKVYNEVKVVEEFNQKI